MGPTAATADRGFGTRVAVVGLALRAPGGINDLSGLWDAVAVGADLTGSLPDDRRAMRSDSWDGLTTRGGYLADAFGFDPKFFGISPREARTIDPQHRVLLELVWEAFEHAALPPSVCGMSAGLFLGITGSDYREWAGPELNSYWTVGNGHCFAVGRVAYALDLGGPALAVDTACSSSLVSVHMAARALAAGDCNVAVAAGVNLILSPRTTRGVGLTGALSPDGRSRPFDARANGFVRAEGGGAVVLKRLEDAEHDQDRVLAVLESSALSQDGRSSSFATPSMGAQTRLLRSLLRQASRAPGDVMLAEAHATGTPIGDPVEVASLREVLDGESENHPLIMGSLKGNIGHAESAAGILSLIKTIACLRRRQAPPQANFQRLNPDIDLGSSRIRIPTEVTALPSGEVHATVSSFGLSGTNAGVLLSAAQPASVPDPHVPAGAGFLVSAVTPTALARLAKAYARQLSSLSAADYPAFLHTSTAGRTVQRHAVWVDAAGVEAARSALDALAADKPSQALLPLASGEPLPKGNQTTRAVIDLATYPFERTPHVLR